MRKRDQMEIKSASEIYGAELPCQLSVGKQEMTGIVLTSTSLGSQTAAALTPL